MHELGKLAKHAIFPALPGEIEDEHARRGAVGERLLRDQRGRQVIIKGRKIQTSR